LAAVAGFALGVVANWLSLRALKADQYAEDMSGLFDRVRASGGTLTSEHPPGSGGTRRPMSRKMPERDVAIESRPAGGGPATLRST
jgi:hypothetical protein